MPTPSVPISYKMGNESRLQKHPSEMPNLLLNASFQKENEKWNTPILTAEAQHPFKRRAAALHEPALLPAHLSQFAHQLIAHAVNRPLERRALGLGSVQLPVDRKIPL